MSGSGFSEDLLLILRGQDATAEPGVLEDGMFASATLAPWPPRCRGDGNLGPLAPGGRGGAVKEMLG